MGVSEVSLQGQQFAQNDPRVRRPGQQQGVHDVENADQVHIQNQNQVARKQTSIFGKILYEGFKIALIVGLSAFVSALCSPVVGMYVGMIVAGAVSAGFSAGEQYSEKGKVDWTRTGLEFGLGFVSFGIGKSIAAPWQILTKASTVPKSLAYASVSSGIQGGFTGGGLTAYDTYVQAGSVDGLAVAQSFVIGGTIGALVGAGAHKLVNRTPPRKISIGHDSYTDLPKINYYKFSFNYNHLDYYKNNLSRNDLLGMYRRGRIHTIDVHGFVKRDDYYRNGILSNIFRGGPDVSYINQVKTVIIRRNNSQSRKFFVELTFTPNPKLPSIKTYDSRAWGNFHDLPVGLQWQILPSGQVPVKNYILKLQGVIDNRRIFVGKDLRIRHLHRASERNFELMINTDDRALAKQIHGRAVGLLNRGYDITTVVNRLEKRYGDLVSVVSQDRNLEVLRRGFGRISRSERVMRRLERAISVMRDAHLHEDRALNRAFGVIYYAVPNINRISVFGRNRLRIQEMLEELIRRGRQNNASPHQGILADFLEENISHWHV